MSVRYKKLIKIPIHVTVACDCACLTGRQVFTITPDSCEDTAMGGLAKPVIGSNFWRECVVGKLHKSLQIGDLSANKGRFSRLAGRQAGLTSAYALALASEKWLSLGFAINTVASSVINFASAEYRSFRLATVNPVESLRDE